jgi:serine protease Do
MFLFLAVLSLLLALAGASCRLDLKKEPAAKPGGKLPPVVEGPQVVPPEARATEGYSDIAEKAVKTVVNISSTKVIRSRGPENSPLFNDPFFRHFFGQQFGNMPRERRERALGSGVIVSKDGYILTNNHVVSDADEVLVVTTDGRELHAKTVGADEKTDLAVVKVPADDLEPIALGDSAKLRLAEVVLAIGNPFGLSGTVTMGIVSALGRTHMGITDYEDFIQTDAAINPGNSGGALINTRGELVGINTAIESRTGQYEGVGFAIPINLARSVMNSLIKFGHVERGYLGVMIQEVKPEMAQALGLPKAGGALVGDVTKDSPAAQAGLQRGDVVIRFNGKDIADTNQLRNLASETPVGSKVEVVVLRDKKEKPFTVTIGRLPQDNTEANPVPANAPEKEESESSVGMTVSALTPALRQHIEAGPNVNGVVVTRVDPDGHAAQAGLQVGDVIMEVNREPVKSGADLKRAVAHPTDKRVLLLVYRGGSTSFVLLRTK